MNKGRSGHFRPFGRCLLLLHLRLGQKHLWRKKQETCWQAKWCCLRLKPCWNQNPVHPPGRCSQRSNVYVREVFSKSKRLKRAESQSLLFEYMSQLFSTCVHERRWDCCVRTSLMQQGVQARLGFCWLGLRRFFRLFPSFDGLFS